MFSFKQFFNLILVLLFVPLVNIFGNSSEGDKIFNSTCMVCHTIGGGNMVGPDLKDVHKRRSLDWIKSFVRSSQSMIKKGDEQAVKLFNEYNRMPMPDQNLNDSQILGIVEYIKERSSPTKKGFVKKIKLPELQPDEVALGQALFTGQKRFDKNGPSCISCHSINIPDVITGGSLAVDLTKVYSRMSDSGVSAIISSPPFPAMACAYENKKLDEDEIFALKAFLRDTNEKGLPALLKSSYSGKLFGIGILGTVIVLVLISFIWSKRKKGPVNKEIFDRQIKSE
jgi:cytochrome c551/c552